MRIKINNNITRDLKKKNFLVSILITNYNKEKFIKKTLQSCINQKFREKQILVYDDASTDNSYNIIRKLKGIKIIINKKNKFTSAPLNQINGIIELFKKSNGELIFLLDGDDEFKKGKLKFISNIFRSDKNLNFIQDQPYLSLKKNLMKLKIKNHYFSIWPSFYPTSCMTVRRNFFKKFIKYSYPKEFPNLEIDARLAIFSYLNKNFKKINKNLTVYNYDECGITSRYPKYSISWWKKRNDAFSYLKRVSKKMNKKFNFSPDYFLTKIINFFI